MLYDLGAGVVVKKVIWSTECIMVLTLLKNTMHKMVL